MLPVNDKVAQSEPVLEDNCNPSKGTGLNLGSIVGSGLKLEAQISFVTRNDFSDT